MFAVIKTGGKQYRVSKDDIIAVEMLDGEAGGTIVFGEVLMLGDKIGAPRLDNTQVVGEIIRQFRDEKKIIFKKRRRNGHRQHLTLVKITDMGLGIATVAAKPAKAAAAPKKAAAPKAAAADGAEKKPAAKKTAAKKTAKKAEA